MKIRNHIFFGLQLPIGNIVEMVPFENHEEIFVKVNPSQPAITCSKLTIETLEQGVKYFQS